MWQSLVDVLDEMLLIYRQLLELGEEKRGHLVQAKPGELEATNRQEASLVIQGNQLENRRAQATAVIVTALGLSNAAPTLSELATLAEADAADRLRDFGRDFGDILKDLTRTNAINAKLTEQALAFVNYNLNLLSRCQVDNIYAPTGNASAKRTGSALLDRKV
jgi:flagellar biosynthesis/type III secretory pathway chaperone